MSDQLPLYQCHKRVRAAKIMSISNNMTGVTVDLRLGEDGVKVSMPGEWLERHEVEVGGYFVQYEDGYQSFSPAKAFEEGYALVVGEPA